MRNARGFTLIEVMIAMAILAVISVLSAQTMKAGIIDRDAVSSEIAAESKVSDAMRIMRSDINASYHYRDIFVTIQNNAQKPDATATPGAAPPAGGLGAAPPPPPPIAPPPIDPQNPNAAAATPRPTPAITTGFVGETESLYFTTLSYERTLQDSQVSDQAKIGYFVKSCRSRSANKTFEDKCLYRAITPFLDEDVDKPGDETVLLEHVSQFKLRYLGPQKSNSNELEYVDTWKTGKSGDDFTREKFPYAVEVTIVTDDKNDPKGKKITASALIPIQFPNNAPKKDATTDPSQPQTGSFNTGVGGQ